MEQGLKSRENDYYVNLGVSVKSIWKSMTEGMTHDVTKFLKLGLYNMFKPVKMLDPIMFQTGTDIQASIPELFYNWESITSSCGT